MTSHLFLALEGLYPPSTLYFREISLLGITLSIGIEEPHPQEETKGGGVTEKYNKKKITFKIHYFEKEITQSFILDEEKPLIKFFFRFLEKIKNIKNKHSIRILFNSNNKEKKDSFITIKKK